MCAIVAGSRGIPLWRAWDEQAHSAADESSAQLLSLEAQLRTLSALRDSARVRTVRAEAERERLIEAPTVAVAGAALATRVTDMADELGVKVSSVQIRPDSVFRAGYAKVAVTLSAVGDVTHLTDLLTALESSDALLAVRELTVSPGDALAPDGKPETLRFQLIVEGLAVRSDAESRAP